MSHIIWSDVALADLQRHFHYLAQHDKLLATRALRVIRDGVGYLKDNPQLGHPVRASGPPRLIWPVKFGKSGYLVQYQLEGGNLVVLAIKHQRERR